VLLLLEHLQLGSELQLTGVVQLEYASQHESSGYEHINPLTGLTVLLSGPQDLVVRQRPPWWTTGRLLAVIGLVGLTLGLALLWAWQLRRQLQRKTRALAAEMHARRNAALEFQATLRERKRLAINLHDTLLQTVSGLGYQIEACEAESLPASERKDNHLETARRMVQRVQDDLRGTVWALRALPLQERNFAEALRVLADKLADGRGVEITVEAGTELPRLSEFVAGNLLLVAQESINNALKHAHPRHIAIRAAVVHSAERIALTVRDDGAGFDAVAQPDSQPGHFGLDGMRERIESLGGEFKIESRPGGGTSVQVQVPLRTFDEELD